MATQAVIHYTLTKIVFDMRFMIQISYDTVMDRFTGSSVESRYMYLFFTCCRQLNDMQIYTVACIQIQWIYYVTIEQQ